MNVNISELFKVSTWDVIGFLILLLLSSPWIVVAFARRNIFFTIVKEGEAKIITLMGGFHKVVMNYKNHILDQDWNVWDLKFLEKIQDGEKLSDSEKERRKQIKKLWGVDDFNEITSQEPHWLYKVLRLVPFLLSFFEGVKIIGIPPFYKVYRYDFQWTTAKQVHDDKTGETIIVPKTRKQNIDYIFVQDAVYYGAIREAETKDMVPVNTSLVFTLRVINPYKAMFKVNNWNEVVLNTVLPVFRDFIALFPFESIHSKKSRGDFLGEGEEGDFLKRYDIDDEVEEKYGIHFVHERVQMQKVNPVEGQSELSKTASDKWRGTQEAKRIEEKASGDKTLLIKIGEGQAGALKALSDEAKKQGVDPNVLVGLNALQEAGKTGNLIIVPSKGQNLMLNIPEKKGGKNNDQSS